MERGTCGYPSRPPGDSIRRRRSPATTPHGPIHGSILTKLILIGAALALALGLAPQRAFAEPPLSAEELELKVMLQARAPEMERTLETWVNVNTGSFHLAGLEQQAALLAERLEALGFQVEQRPGSEVELPGRGRFTTGPIVLGRLAASARPDAAPRMLLVGHYDTVFEPGSQPRGFQRDPDAPDRATGPGATDMKGGLVILLEALQALRDAGALGRAHWVVLLNADEEIGSLGSRPLIEAEAREADYGFVFESAQGSGAMVRSRRGLGQFHLRVQGVAAHAGSAHERGRSAIRALAAKVLEIEELTDYERGLTVNVGTIEGGTKRNIVPDSAEAWIDVRYDEPSLGEEVKANIESIAATAHVEGTQTEVWGTLHRPPKLATTQVDRLIELHGQVARALGQPAPAARHSGGGTDGSLMGAVGLATLDSMGAVGGRAHTDEEYVDLGSLPQRATIAAILLHRLVSTRLYAPGSGG